MCKRFTCQRTYVHTTAHMHMCTQTHTDHHMGHTQTHIHMYVHTQERMYAHEKVNRQTSRQNKRMDRLTDRQTDRQTNKFFDTNTWVCRFCLSVKFAPAYSVYSQGDNTNKIYYQPLFNIAIIYINLTICKN